MMTLRDKLQKLLEVSALPEQERKLLAAIPLMTDPNKPLEDQMYPRVRAHIEGRFEWFFKPSGELRRAA